MKLGASAEGLPIDTIIKVLVVPGSIPEIDKALVDSSATGGGEHSTGLFGALCDDIDHTVDSICSPNSATRASDDLDPFDIFEQGVLDLPIDASEERRVHAAAVDEHEYRS